MATVKALRFFRATSLPAASTSIQVGDIYFIKPTDGVGQIHVCTASSSSSVSFVKYGDATVYTHPDVTRTNTTSSASPAHGATFTAIGSITSNAQGHVTGVDTKTVTLPAETVLNITQSGSGGYISGVTKGTGSHDITVTHTALPTIGVTGGAAESGKYISAISASDHTITVTKASIPSGTGSKTAGSGEFIDSVSLSGHSLTGTSKAFITDVANNGTSTVAPTTAAIKSYVDTLVSSGVHIRGTIGSSEATITVLPTSGVVVGDAYVVKTAGTYSPMTEKVEVGDMIICTAISGSTITWSAIQNNIDIATSSKPGLVKSSTTGTTSGRNYNVEVNSDGTMKVNVPWENTVITGTTGTKTLTHGGTFTAVEEISKTGDRVTGLKLTTFTMPAGYSHPNSGVSKGTYGDTGNSRTLAYGGTFNVVEYYVNEQGHLTSSATKTLTLPGQYVHPEVTKSDSTNSATPGFGGTFTVVDTVTRDTKGHVTGINTKTVTVPATYASSSAAGIIKTGTSLEVTSGVCNVVWTDFGS